MHVRTGNGLMTSGWEPRLGSRASHGPSIECCSVGIRAACVVTDARSPALKRTQKGNEDEWTGLAVQP